VDAAGAGQLSLADRLVDVGAGPNRQLEMIAALVEWAAFGRLGGTSRGASAGAFSCLNS
jgi:hypothetical protein